jgi:hypothetical protein
MAISSAFCSDWWFILLANDGEPIFSPFPNETNDCHKPVAWAANLTLPAAESPFARPADRSASRTAQSQP